MKGGDPRYPYRATLTTEQAERLGENQSQVLAWRAERRALPIVLQLFLATGAGLALVTPVPLAPTPLVIGALVIMVLRQVQA